jgi:ArsR family transcriptional regulator
MSLTSHVAHANVANMARMPSDLALSRTAQLFAAFANEGRLRALVALSRHGPLNVSALLPLCGLEQTALSHQLRILRTAQLVRATRRGKQVVYAAADDHIAGILEDGLAHAAERTGARKGKHA